MKASKCRGGASMFPPIAGCTSMNYLGAAPLRGARTGGQTQELSVEVRVAQAAQAQN
jgi:hypothetical protein